MESAKDRPLQQEKGVKDFFVNGLFYLFKTLKCHRVLYSTINKTSIWLKTHGRIFFFFLNQKIMWWQMQCMLVNSEDFPQPWKTAPAVSLLQFYKLFAFYPKFTRQQSNICHTGTYLRSKIFCSCHLHEVATDAFLHSILKKKTVHEEHHLLKHEKLWNKLLCTTHGEAKEMEKYWYRSLFSVHLLPFHSLLSIHWHSYDKIILK